MKTSRFASVIVVALAVVPIVLAACSDASNGPAATVGNAEISREQVEADVVAFRFFAGQSDTPCGAPAGDPGSSGECTRLVLSNDIQEEIVKAYARANDIVVAPADVDDAIAQLETDLGGADALDSALADAGLTRNDLQGVAERLLLFTEVQKAVVAERQDEAALPALYEQQKAQLTTMEVSHILLPTRAAAEEVAAGATPENFAALAQRRSVDPGSAATGGSLGSFSEAEFRQGFDPTFVEATLALEPGEISGVVHTSFGYHVIELVSRDVPTFEEAREQLIAQQSAQIFGDWLRERYDSLEIHVDPRYGRLDVATGQVVPLGNTPDPSAPAGGTAPVSPST